MKRSFIISSQPARLLTMSSAAIALALGWQALAHAQTAQPGSDTPPPIQQNQQPLSKAECDQLYTHQLKLVRSDPTNPLFSSVELNAEILENPASRAAEVRQCQKVQNRAGFACQMAATNLAGLLRCRRDFAPDKNEQNDGNANNTNSGDSQQKPGPAEFEDNSRPNGTQAETLPSGRFAVNAANCDRAYAHVFRVIAATNEFQQRADRTRLVEYWQSDTARDAFRSRCQTEFKPEDLGCLLSTQDADIVQGCLLVIPPA